MAYSSQSDSLPPAFQKACEQYANDLASHLTSSLQATINPRLLSASAGAGSELVAAMDGPYCQLPILVKKAEQQGAIIVQDPFAAFLVQVLLGAPAMPPDMPVPCLWTDLERDLLSGFLQRIVERSASAWEASGMPGFAVSGAVTCGDLSSENWYHQSCGGAIIEMEVNGMIGCFCLVLPAGPLGGGTHEEAAEAPKLAPSSAVRLMKLIERSGIEVAVELAGPSIPAGEFARLQPGQILLLDHSIHAPLTLTLNGKACFTGMLAPGPNHRRALNDLAPMAQSAN